MFKTKIFKSITEYYGCFLSTKSENNIKIDAEKVTSWIKKGAKPSETVAALLKKEAE